MCASADSLWSGQFIVKPESSNTNTRTKHKIIQGIWNENIDTLHLKLTATIKWDLHLFSLRKVTRVVIVRWRLNLDISIYDSSLHYSLEEECWIKDKGKGKFNWIKLHSFIRKQQEICAHADMTLYYNQCFFRRNLYIDSIRSRTVKEPIICFSCSEWWPHCIYSYTICINARVWMYVYVWISQICDYEEL